MSGIEMLEKWNKTDVSLGQRASSAWASVLKIEQA
jgi:hypothetical protein